ncbi:MAG: DNA-protecting protein DprA [Deltaproteobacteria bacterium]|nr:DNA-protecting protein DprA [Deltaproteobacteria bacterium]
MERETLKYWLALNRVKGLKKPQMEALAGKDLSPEGLFKGRKSEAAARREHGFTEELLEGIGGFDGWGRIAEELALLDKSGISVVTYGDPAYPGLLREIDDPPCLLYVKGLPLEALKDNDTVAVVGTRQPSPYGAAMSGAIGRDLAIMGVTVASGMARGCDSFAHKGALSANGLTIAVLGSGIDIVYPRENRRLYDEISGKGILISEFPLSTPPQPHNFLKRNRIISGISKGVVVVEAPVRSGALQTAGLALGYNREVMAVPGQATSEKGRGVNKLLKEGAALVECAGDVMGVLGLTPRKALAIEEKSEKPAAGQEERLLLKALDNEPLHIDAIAKKAKMPVIKASSLLLEMELKGLVTRTHGMRFLKRFFK